MHKSEQAVLIYALLVGIALFLLACKGITLMYYACKMISGHVYERLGRRFPTIAHKRCLSPARLAAGHVCQWGDPPREDGM